MSSVLAGRVLTALRLHTAANVPSHPHAIASLKSNLVAKFEVLGSGRVGISVKVANMSALPKNHPSCKATVVPLAKEVLHTI